MVVVVGVVAVVAMDIVEVEVVVAVVLIAIVIVVAMVVKRGRESLCVAMEHRRMTVHTSCVVMYNARNGRNTGEHGPARPAIIIAEAAGAWVASRVPA